MDIFTEHKGGRHLSKKDTISKIYMSKNEIFADAVNFYFFDGKQTVRPEHLRELSPEELALPYGKEGQSGHFRCRNIVIFSKNVR